MKTIAVFAVSLLILSPLQTQVVRAQALGGALLGGVAGAIIGNNSGGHHAGRGALIGSVAGAMIGSAVTDSSGGYYSGAPVPAGYYSFGYSSGGGRRGHDRHGSTYFGYASPVYSSGYYDRGYYNGGYYDRGYIGRPSYASSGLLLGGLAGGIIGHNSHSHHAWRGAAIGAGAGLLLGAIADENARDYERREALIEDARRAAAVQAAAEQKAAPQNVTIINNYYSTPSTPMGAANSMFGR